MVSCQMAKILFIDADASSNNNFLLKPLFRSMKVAKWSLFFLALHGTTYQAKKQKSR